MTDRTNLEVAASALMAHLRTRSFRPEPWAPPEAASFNPTAEDVTRAALDAIHPALADLTPDDVAAIFDLVHWYMAAPPDPPPPMTEHVWEVLSRD